MKKVLVIVMLGDGCFYGNCYSFVTDNIEDVVNVVRNELELDYNKKRIIIEVEEQ